ncbi:MAG: alpha/beta hydrolase [Thermodesulfobacteriota bacterium]
MRLANGISLGCTEAGPEDGRLVLLLHGFPEIAYAWRRQVPELAAAGFRVVAPDQRGYNESSKPRGVAAYDLDRLADDVVALADALSCRTFSIVGHDWGASVGWWTAGLHPERVERLAVLNAPHPAVWKHAMLHDPAQRKLSWYVQAFRIPWLPELLLLRARITRRSPTRFAASRAATPSSSATWRSTAPPGASRPRSPAWSTGIARCSRRTCPLPSRRRASACRPRSSGVRVTRSPSASSPSAAAPCATTRR